MSVLDGDPLRNDAYCFACGQENPHGLAMRVQFNSEGSYCNINLAKHYQGWTGIAHGGIICTLLDEIMAYAVLKKIGQGVTVNLKSRFRKPVPLDKELLVKGQVVSYKGRRAEARATIEMAGDGAVLAEGEATWLIQLDKEGKPVEFKF